MRTLIRIADFTDHRPKHVLERFRQRAQSRVDADLEEEFQRRVRANIERKRIGRAHQLAMLRRQAD